jgi:hypothetical protein
LRKILKQYKDANLWRLLKDGIDRLIKLSKAGSLMLKTMEFWCKILLLIEQQQHGLDLLAPGPNLYCMCASSSYCHCSEPLHRATATVASRCRTSLDLVERFFPQSADRATQALDCSRPSAGRCSPPRAPRASARLRPRLSMGVGVWRRPPAARG